MPKDTRPKGTIATRFEVWCGECAAWELLPALGKKLAAEDAKRFGWVRTREQGWLCPLCAKEKGQC